MANSVRDFSIASGGTQSNGVDGQGQRLMGLNIPAIDSAAITFQHSIDGGTTWRDVKDHDGTTPAAINLGAADAGDKAVFVPDSVSKLSATGQLRIVLGAAQNSGAVTLKGLYERLY